jgi:hypothetical protein
MSTRVVIRSDQLESFIARRVMGTGTAFRTCGRQWTVIGRLLYLVDLPLEAL